MFIFRCIFVFILSFQNKRLHKIKGVKKKKKIPFSHTRTHAKDRIVPSMPMSDTDTSRILGC